MGAIGFSEEQRRGATGKAKAGPSRSVVWTKAGAILMSEEQERDYASRPAEWLAENRYVIPGEAE